METQRLRTTGLVAAGVVAAGGLAAASLLVGALGAQAADETAGNTSAPAGMVMHHRGPAGPDRGDDLAEALGVSQQKLRAALREIRDDVKPAERPDGPPTPAEREEHRDKLTAALAEELGLSEAKVEAAFEKVHKAHRAERRDALSDRLDAAVKNGKLTTDDKASVLKAFDAGVWGHHPGSGASLGEGGPGPR